MSFLDLLLAEAIAAGLAREAARERQPPPENFFVLPDDTAAWKRFQAASQKENMVVAIEHHVEWVTDCIAYMVEHNHLCVEVTKEAQDTWVAHVNEVAGNTLHHTCHSWYFGDNIPGKPQVFMPLWGFPPYVEKCKEVAAKEYEGFVLS